MMYEQGETMTNKAISQDDFRLMHFIEFIKQY